MAEFVKIAKLSELPSGTGKTVRIDGRDVALFHAEGKVYAIDNTCAHMGGPLGEGSLEGCVVTCPWHAWHYDVRTGQCTNRPAKVAAHEAKVEGDDVLVALAAVPKA